MNTTSTFSINNATSTVRISVEEFEHLIACKKELMAIKEELKLVLGEEVD